MDEREAVTRNDFVKVQKYSEIYGRLNSENPIVNTQILIGRSGVGKTELALQILRSFKEQRGGANHILSTRFNCDSVANLADGLTSFADKKSLQIPSLRVHRENLEQPFGEFFKEVNRCYPNHLKCFIFDDAELSTHVIKCIDRQICKALLEPNNAGQRKNWKIVVTSQVDDRRSWLDGCECLSPNHFISIEGFNEDEVLKFFTFFGNRLLSEDDVKEVISELGGVPMLPLVLKVLRADIQTSRDADMVDIRYFLRTFFERIKKLDRSLTEDRVLAALLVSLKRLVEGSRNPQEYEQMVRMLTMYDGRNFTTHMLFSCAEVVLSTGNDEGDHKAADLMVSFVGDMKKRFLCDQYRTGLYGFHKLIKSSMMLFRRPQDDTRDLDTVRNAVLALTRVMPKDGRGHHSHNIFGFMYNHGKALAEEIEELRRKGVVNRQRAPCVMLMYCNLLTGMGYCQLARRNPTQLAIAHLEQALDVYSQLMTDQTHKELLGRHQTVEAVADTLYDESVRSSLLDDPFYSNLVKSVTRYYRVTRKDLRHLKDLPPDTPEDDMFLLNGHFNDAHIRDLHVDRKLLDPQLYLRRHYPIELLAELYAIWAKSDQLQKIDRLSNTIFAYGKAALVLYSRIQREQGVLLMGEVITRRELLKIRLLRAESLPPIEQGWEALKALGDRAFEYGLMRTDFAKDTYHRFLCDEGLADCIGELYLRTPSDATYVAGDLLFQELVVRSKEEKLNLQTTSKSHRHHAEFRLRCGRQREAIRAAIDSMKCLHEFLCSSDLTAPFPEQQETCGKFKSLLDLLNKCYNFGEDGRRLRSDGEDAHRLEYLRTFLEHWRQEDDCGLAGGADRFGVMKNLLDDSGYDSDEGVNMKGPVQSTH